jgi:hypothetical protein
LWASAEAVSPGRAAKAIADQLQKLEPPLDDEGIQFVLWELNRTIGQNEMSELAEGFNTSHSGDVYRRMLAHEENIAAKRKEHELRNDPVEVERRRAEKKAKKAQQHSIRLSAKAERDAANAMGPPNLSFEISFPTLDLFLDHWASRYRDENDKKFYDPYIGKADLKTDEAALKDLFRWKNGVRLSAAKLVSIRANYFDDWTEDANLERRYLDPSEDGDRPIWNIFYLHCRFPDQYPIYDQHAHRAMIYIQEHAIREDLSKKPELVYKSYKQYRCFVAHIRRATGHKLRTIDRALYTFGQFLKLAKPFWNPAQHQP